MSQLSVLGLTISHGSPASGGSKSSASTSWSDSSASVSPPGSDAEGPAAYHTNLANLLPSLQVPAPLRGMSRLRAVAQRQWVGHLDVLGVLAKVVMRPHPVINLGPIDHTASCVIVDLDLPDRPLIWASESFCQMSGYNLDDIRGRNPRFMQAPGGHVLTPQASPRPTRKTPPRPVPTSSNSGSSSSTDTIDIPTPVPPASPRYTYIPPPASHVPAGSDRPHTDGKTVAHIRTKLDANEEVQATVLNYRRDGTPFWNWLSIVPVREAGEGSRFKYHVGIMVDLVQQPRAIMQTMQAGYYVRSQS